MPQKCNFVFSIPYFLCTANVFFNYFSLFALQMWVTFFNFSTENVFKFLFFFTANVHHFLYTLLKLLPVKCCLKFFSPRPPLRSSLGKLKNNFRGGGAQKKRTFFSLFLILGLCFFFSSIAFVHYLIQPFRKDIQAINRGIFIPINGHFGWTLDCSPTDSWHFHQNHVPKTVLNQAKIVEIQGNMPISKCS